MIRHGRPTTILLTFLLVLAAPATVAWADNGSGSTIAETAETKPAEDTSTKPAVETKAPEDTTTKPSTETVVPEPEAPVTEAPVTTTPTTPTTPDVTPDAPNAIPTQPNCAGSACVPSDGPAVDSTPGSGAQLPFTGPGDVALAIVLALLAGTGGILFLMGATGREQIEGLSKRSMDSPSGWHLAYRNLRKQQLDEAG